MNILVLLSGYISLVIGLCYFGYSQGLPKCDPYNPNPVDVGHRYRGGMAGIIIGCILIAFYHVNQIRNY